MSRRRELATQEYIRSGLHDLRPLCVCSLTFYSPQLFITLGTGAEQALAAVIVIGVVGHLSGYVAVWAADIYGRRILWIQGGVQVQIWYHIRFTKNTLVQPPHDEEVSLVFDPNRSQCRKEYRACSQLKSVWLPLVVLHMFEDSYLFWPSGSLLSC